MKMEITYDDARNTIYVEVTGTNLNERRYAIKMTDTTKKDFISGVLAIANIVEKWL